MGSTAFGATSRKALNCIGGRGAGTVGKEGGEQRLRVGGGETDGGGDEKMGRILECAVSMVMRG